MIVIQFIMYLFWGIVGLIFWVPILSRVTISFIGRILFDTISGKITDVVTANKIIAISADFYFNGFKLINDRFQRLTGVEGEPIYEELKSPYFTYAKNIIWTIIFWGVVLFPIWDQKLIASSKIFFDRIQSNNIPQFDERSQNVSMNIYFAKSPTFNPPISKKQYYKIHDTEKLSNCVTSAHFTINDKDARNQINLSEQTISHSGFWFIEKDIQLENSCKNVPASITLIQSEEQ